jgi:voltage-gated potassium channel
MTGQHPPPQHFDRRRHPLIRKTVDHPVFGVTVVLLVILSVLLLLIEAFLPIKHPFNEPINIANDFITYFFIFELFLRWVVAKSLRDFIRNQWIDMLAVLPMLRVFRLSRVFRLLRLFRMFSLATILQRRMRVFGSVLEGRFVEYGILLVLMLFALVFGTLGLIHFEVPSGISELHTPEDAFWKALFSLLAGEYADYPDSIGGKVIFTFLLLFGMGFFAMLTGTISAVMIEKLKENAMQKMIPGEDLRGHIVICGFSSKVGIIIKEFQSDPGFQGCEIVLISRLANIDALKALNVSPENIFILSEDFTHMEILRKAGINQARIAIILSEPGANRTLHDIDARTMLAALTIEKLNREVHTCAEIYHPEYADHLKMGGVNDVVIQGEVSGSLLARAAMQKGVLPFFQDLLSSQTGNFLAFVPVPDYLIGKDVDCALPQLHEKNHFVLVGVRPPGGSLQVNPTRHVFAQGDEMLVIRPLNGG